MKHIQAVSGAALAFVFAVGCGAGDMTESSDGLEGGDPGVTTPLDEALGATGASAGAESRAASGSKPGNANDLSTGELARIDFADGNSVRFQELDGGVLVTEVGSELNPPRLVPKNGMSALEAFRALAPEREVPSALLQAHARMYPAESLDVESSSSAARQVTPSPQDQAPDPDLRHNGEFQQTGGLYPASSFLQGMCDFSNTSPNYKHTNRTAAHTDTTNNINTAYFAVASDIGIITARPCSNGACGATITLQAGFHNSGFFDAGLKCETSGGIFCSIFGHRHDLHAKTSEVRGPNGKNLEFSAVSRLFSVHPIVHAGRGARRFGGTRSSPRTFSEALGP